MVMAPVWVISPTEVVVRPPVRVVTPKDVAPPALVVRLPFTEPAKLISPTEAVRLVAPKNELPALFRVMSPVEEIIEDAAPVVIAPVWVISPTEVVVRPPASVVTPKDVVPPALVVRLPFTEPAKLISPTLAVRLVAPKNELFGFERSISPVLEVIEEGAPVVIAPVWVMSPTEVVFSPPVSVVTPKDVVPPETVVRLTAVPPTMRLPAADTEALPVAAMRASRLPEASTETLAPANEVAPKNELFGSVRVMLPVVEVIEEGAPVTIGPFWVMAPTEVVVRPPVSVVAPKDVAPPERVVRFAAVPAIARLPLVATETSAPLTVTKPRRSLPALLRVIPVGTPPWVAVAEVVP